jgi:glucose-6-phosphate dehydrogenase assembly protein OpcA
VADAVTALAEWEDADASIGDVLDALHRLRGSDRTASRTSVVTLVAVARSDDELQRACDASETLGGRHPGRTVVVHAKEDEPEGLEARVRLIEGTADGASVWSEDVTLTVKGPAARHLDSLVEPLTLPDLPLAVWYVGTCPDVDDALCDTAEVVLVDSKEIGGPGGFADLVPVYRNRTLIDLTWVRLTPWRLLLASLFEGKVYRPYVTKVTEAEVRGKPGVRELLGGWLASRLDLSEVGLEDDKHASMRLVAGDGEFTFGRHTDEGMVRAAAWID